MYVFDPDDANPANEATFENDYNSYTMLMGTAPQFIVTYVDYTQPVSA